MRFVVSLLALLLAAACTPGGGAADAGPADAGPDAWYGSATALYELPRGGQPTSEYYALPFPNDLRMREDGTIDFEGHVRPNALLEEYLDTFSQKAGGFGTNSAIFFRFSAPIDPASLPETAAKSLEADASVYLVDVDPDSPERGLRRPLRFRFEHYAGEAIGPDWLSCLPYPGFPLRRATTYAVVVTRRATATDGSALASSADLDQVLAADGGDPDVTRAREVYAPLLAWLDEAGGDERQDVAAATVFTTMDPTALMGKIREVVWRDAPAPVLRELKFAGEYDSFNLYTGVYDGPNFQLGTPPYSLPADGGEILVDPATGDPILQRMEPIRVAISIPHGAPPPGGWPVVLYAHGTGGSYKSFVHDGTAGRFGWEGIAAVGIDQVLHGPRNPAGGSEEVAFFNFQNPLAGRDNVRQGALDDFQLVRLVMDMVIDERHPGGRRHTFDAERMYFMGHSQGGLTGPPFLAYEPLIKGAILSGAGGLIYYSLTKKTEPVDIASLIGSFVRDVPLDEFNNILALVQMFIEPADPVNYGPLLVAEPIEGVGAKDIFQSEGLIDHYTPPVNIEALGVAIGASPVGPILVDVEGFELRGLDVLTAPVVGNLNGKTAVFLQYEAASGEDGHFVVFDVDAAQRQSIQFITTLAREGAATLVP